MNIIRIDKKAIQSILNKKPDTYLSDILKIIEKEDISYYYMQKDAYDNLVKKYTIKLDENHKTDFNLANFFWYRGNLTLFARKCLESFVKKGFTVYLWSYDNTIDISGLKIQLKDANTLIPEEIIKNVTQRDKQGCVAAISDIIRYQIIKHTGGWYFDTDVFCLQSKESFHRLLHNRIIVAGYESDNIIASNVLFIKSKQFIDDIITACDNILKKYQHNIPWGLIGPQLITDMVNKHNLTSHILSKNFFNPIHFSHINKLLVDTSLDVLSDSFSIHLWNNILSQKIDTNIIPSTNTLLFKLFNSQKSFNVVLTTINRSTLPRMINSIAGQLTEIDYLTLIVDKKDSVLPSINTKATIIYIYNSYTHGFWGHISRTKWQKYFPGDYIINCDDDDMFTEKAMEKIRSTCVDNKLYLFKMKWKDNIYWNTKKLLYGNIGTPCGVYSNISNLPEWPAVVGGDFYFLNELANKLDVEFIDYIIYIVKPS